MTTLSELIQLYKENGFEGKVVIEKAEKQLENDRAEREREREREEREERAIEREIERKREERAFTLQLAEKSKGVLFPL
jgi:predicted nucleotidyltransferase